MGEDAIAKPDSLKPAAEDDADFSWESTADWQLARGTFTVADDIGEFEIDFFTEGLGENYTDPDVPEPGTGFWYLVRHYSLNGSYSTDADSEAPGRDEALVP